MGASCRCAIKMNVKKYAHRMTAGIDTIAALSASGAGQLILAAHLDDCDAVIQRAPALRHRRLSRRATSARFFAAQDARASGDRAPAERIPPSLGDEGLLWRSRRLSDRNDHAQPAARVPAPVIALVDQVTTGIVMPRQLVGLVFRQPQSAVLAKYRPCGRGVPEGMPTNSPG
jgi:hypothetical protein